MCKDNPAGLSPADGITFNGLVNFQDLTENKSWTMLGDGPGKILTGVLRVSELEGSERMCVEKGPVHSEVIMDRDRIVSRVGNNEIIQTKDEITGHLISKPQSRGEEVRGMSERYMKVEIQDDELAQALDDLEKGRKMIEDSANKLRFLGVATIKKEEAAKGD